MFTLANYRVLSTGLAMFSMFFGAGNVIFPLVIGQTAGNQTPFAISGLLLTAVGVPFLGLLAIVLFKGNYQNFFNRLGKVPGFLIAAFIMLLIGPFGGLPRCIALSYATLNHTWTSLPFEIFSSLACLLIFLCTWKKSRIVDIVGTFLTPLLLLCLFVIVIAGLLTAEQLPASDWSAGDAFKHGLIEGYNTMDLLASFFFSSIIFNSLSKGKEYSEKKIFSLAVQASCIGAALLGIVYIGFSLVAAYHADGLAFNGSGELLGALTLKILGPYAGLVASATIALACLTTAIALAAVFAEFLQKVITQGRISYFQSLLITLVLSYGVSTLEFSGIVALLSPVLQIVYPALILFTIANIAWKLRQENKKANECSLQVLDSTIELIPEA
jgi:branched-chain amino acid:cation transporter, LIVCS family